MPNILEQKIHTFSPMQDGQRFVAIINGFPAHFFGNTAMQAHKAADDWRLIHTKRFAGKKFPAELVEKAEAAIERAATRKAERPAKP